MRMPWRKTLIAVAVAAGIYGIAATIARERTVAVAVVAVQRCAVDWTVANTRAGTIKAHRRAHVSPLLSGRVVEIGAREGDRVESGQVLLRLWADDLLAELEVAKAECVRAKALVDQAEARSKLAKSDARRATELRREKVASEDEVEHAAAESAVAEAAHRAALAGAEVRQSSIRAMEAKLARTVVLAPFAGIVAELNAEFGEVITPSPTGIATPPAVDLIDDSSIYVSAPIDEVDAARITIGMQARVTLDAFGDQTFMGRVTRIAPYVLDREKQARTVDVEVVLQPQNEAADSATPESPLLAGYSADVEIVIDRRRDTLRVPTEAVLPQDRVLLRDPESGRLIERSFRPGLANWAFTEVLEGLEADDLVVTSLGRDGVATGALTTIDNQEP